MQLQGHLCLGVLIISSCHRQQGRSYGSTLPLLIACSARSLAGPQKDDVTTNKAADVEYYAKVMGISALIGYSIKLALLANVGVPDPGSVGVVVQPHLWKRQVVISIIGMVVLSLMVLSNASYMLNQSRAWVYQLPYM